MRVGGGSEVGEEGRSSGTTEGPYLPRKLLSLIKVVPLAKSQTLFVVYFTFYPLISCHNYQIFLINYIINTGLVKVSIIRND